MEMENHLSYKLNKAIALRNRIEILWYDGKGENKQAGFFTFIDIIYKPMLAKYSGVLRLQYFEIDSYDSHIHAYENDVLYSYSIPAFQIRAGAITCTWIMM